MEQKLGLSIFPKDVYHGKGKKDAADEFDLNIFVKMSISHLIFSLGHSIVVP